MRLALYARVSTADQTAANQLLELRAYAARAGAEVVEYVDEGVSGSSTSRPALDRLLADCRRRKVTIVVVWSLDRLGRSLSHLVGLCEEWRKLGVSLVSLREGIDLTTPAGRLIFGFMANLAEFEKERLRERVSAGLERARSQGVRLGRRPTAIDPAGLVDTAALSVRVAAKLLGVSSSVLQRARPKNLKN